MSEALTYVLDIDGNPLMPTRRCGKVRRLLKAKKAKVESQELTTGCIQNTKDGWRLLWSKRLHAI